MHALHTSTFMHNAKQSCLSSLVLQAAAHAPASAPLPIPQAWQICSAWPVTLCGPAAYDPHPGAALQVATRGVDNVEEMDPLERMRKAYGLNATSQQREPTRIASIEEELASINSKIDIRDFDYKPVPRPVDD
eukprot:350767-Chlamydomonas_euryale.AAC.6